MHPIATARTRRASAIAARRVLVWDRAVRLFHWLLVAAVCLAWLSGGSGHRVHEIAGFAIAALVTFRALWGLVGSRHARFADFVRSPLAVVRYVAAHANGHPPRHLGHNPAGGYMILALLATIATICVTGAMQLTNRYFGVTWVEDLHHVAANALWALVALHVIGTIGSGLLHHENLVAAMMTGWKRPDERRALPTRQRRRLKLEHRSIRAHGRRGAALLSLFLCGGLSAGLVATSGRVHTDIADVPPVLAAAGTPKPVPPAKVAPNPPQPAAVRTRSSRTGAAPTRNGSGKQKTRTAAAPTGKGKPGKAKKTPSPPAAAPNQVVQGARGSLPPPYGLGLPPR